MDPEDLESIMNDLVSDNLERLSCTIAKIGGNIEKLCTNPDYLNYEFQPIDEYRAGIGCHLFRGQRNHNWRLLSGIERDPMSTIDIIRHEAAKCRLVHALHSSDTFLKNNSLNIRGATINTRLMRIQYEEYAQHYGFKTHMLDWTMDPKTAMFFACTDGNLNGCTPLSEKDVKSVGMSSIFIRDYHMSLEDSLQGPRVIGAGILQRSLFQKGFVSRGPVEACKFDIRIDPSYCEEIAREFDYGKKLTDMDNPDQLSEAFQIIKDLDAIPETCINTICRATRKPYSELIGIIKEEGMEVCDWDHIDSISPDIGHMMDEMKYAHIDDYKTIVERCMDGHVMSIDEAYELLTTIKLEMRVYREIMEHRRSPDSFDFILS